MVAALAAVAFALSARAVPTAEDFFRPPAVSSAKLNPSGTHLALLIYDLKTDSTGLRIIDLAAKTATGLTGDKVYDVHSFEWVDDERLVFTVTRENLYSTGLLLIHRDLKKSPRLLNENDAVELVSVPKARPDRLYVWVRQEARYQGQPGPLVEVNLSFRGERGFDVDYGLLVAGTIATPPGDGVRAWLPDRQGEIRYAVTHKAGLLILNRREPNGSWVPLKFDLNQYTPLGVDNDPNCLFVARLTADGLRELVRLDTRDGSTGPVLHSDPKYDFGQGKLNLSGDHQRLVSLSYARQAPQQSPLAPEESTLQRMINASLPNRVNLIIDRNKDDSRLLVRSSSDRHPATLYLFEPGKPQLSLITETAPWLQAEKFCPVQTMSYKARDGLILDSYVTLPLDYQSGKPAPMIVLPHGGPWARDNWSYDPESQFFASRGYVVFRPNYRGSTGYKADISLTPRMEFRQMHDDVTDGVHALIKAGVADPAHIAIIGGSFGGYLAMCGAAFEPDLYKCAVTIAGVFDWERQMREAHRNNPDSFSYDFLRLGLGDPAKQAEKFEAMSPVRSVDKIHIPIFVAHGGDDRTVDSSQSTRLVKALKQAGVPCETMFEKWEGHGFYTLKNRVELYTRIEAFLRKNL